MKSTAFYDALIRAIEKIYYRISRIVLRKRMDGYHKPASQGFISHENNIKSPLLDYIDNVIVNNPGDSQTLNNNDGPVLNTTTHLDTPAKSQPDKPHAVDKRNAEQLSSHFKTRTNGHELHPEIVIKLEHSIWEHIHATTRYARQGDKYNARMHTDIANSACKELAHYMTDEHYQVFIQKIAEYLDSLKSD